jgi:hypothetical protein
VSSIWLTRLIVIIPVTQAHAIIRPSRAHARAGGSCSLA